MFFRLELAKNYATGNPRTERYSALTTTTYSQRSAAQSVLRGGGCEGEVGVEGVGEPQGLREVAHEPVVVL